MPIATAHRPAIARTPKSPTFLPYSTVPVTQPPAVSLNLGQDKRQRTAREKGILLSALLGSKSRLHSRLRRRIKIDAIPGSRPRRFLSTSDTVYASASGGPGVTVFTEHPTERMIAYAHLGALAPAVEMVAEMAVLIAVKGARAGTPPRATAASLPCAAIPWPSSEIALPAAPIALVRMGDCPATRLAARCRAASAPAPRSVRCPGSTPGTSSPRCATPSARDQSLARSAPWSPPRSG